MSHWKKMENNKNNHPKKKANYSFCRAADVQSWLSSRCNGEFTKWKIKKKAVLEFGTKTRQKRNFLISGNVTTVKYPTTAK